MWACAVSESDSDVRAWNRVATPERGKYVSVRTDSATDDLARYLVEDGALYNTREVPHSEEVSPSFVGSLCARCTLGESVAGFWNQWSVHNDSDMVYSWTSAWCCAHKLWLS